MTCEETQALLLDPQDPAVSRQRLLEAASHALSCESCRHFAEDLSKLESILRVPADDAIALPSGGYGALADRFAQTDRTYGRIGHSRRWLSYAAAAVIGGVVAGAYFVGAQQGVVHTEKQALAPHTDAQLVFSPSEVRRSSKAFAEVSQAFDNRASWVLTGEHAADVGVVQSPVDPTHPVLLLKLVLRSGKEILSSGDLAIVSGRDAHVTLPLSDGKTVRYSINTRIDQPDRLDISAELLDGNGSAKPLAALSTRMQPRDGQPVRMGEMATSNGEYEVIVSFARAEAKDGN